MPTLTENRRLRTATLCALYAAQGMPWGFVTVTLLGYLASRGMDLEGSSRITALALLPWSFKVVWGLVIDRFTFRPMGRRRPWVLLAQLGIGATLLAMILIKDLSAEVETLAWMVFIHNCFVSLQDVATDALAVDLLADEERGRVNGLMWASSYVGIAIGGAGMGTVLAHFGLRAAFALQVSVLLAIACFPLFLREHRGERLLPWTRGEARPDDGRGTESFFGLARRLVRAFRLRAPLVGILFSAASALVIGMFGPLHPVYFTQVLGWTQERYSQLDGGAGSIAGVLGALTGGFIVDRLGVRRVYTIAALLVAAMCFTLSSSEALRLSSPCVVGYLVAINFLTSAQTVAGFSLFMRLCTPALAGTQFTLFMAASNFSRAGASRLVGMLEQQGYGVIFGMMGLVMLASLPLLFALPALYVDPPRPVATPEPPT